MNEVCLDELVSDIWHWCVEDKMPWKSCAGILKMNYDVNLKPMEVKKRFQKYFENLTGIAPYKKCPKCNGELLPRERRIIEDGEMVFSPFIGCDKYPQCKFLASSSKKYVS